MQFLLFAIFSNYTWNPELICDKKCKRNSKYHIMTVTKIFGRETILIHVLNKMYGFSSWMSFNSSLNIKLWNLQNLSFTLTSSWDKLLDFENGCKKFYKSIGDLAAIHARKIMMRCLKLLEKKGNDKYHQERRKLEFSRSRGVPHWWVKSSGVRQSKIYKCQLALMGGKGLRM